MKSLSVYGQVDEGWVETFVLRVGHHLWCVIRSAGLLRPPKKRYCMSVVGLLVALWQDSTQQKLHTNAVLVTGGLCEPPERGRLM